MATRQATIENPQDDPEGVMEPGWTKPTAKPKKRWSSHVAAAILPALALLILMVCAMTEPVQQWPSCDAHCKSVRAEQREAYLRESIAAAEARVAAQVADITDGRKCWTDGRNEIPSTLVVHDVKGDEVREVSFADGYKAASAGRVWVDAKCA